MRSFLLTRGGFCAVSVVALLLFRAASTRGDEPSVPSRSSQGAGGKVGDFADEHIQAAGGDRVYHLIVPESVDPKKPAPLIFAFHGALIDNRNFMPIYSQLGELAKEKGAIIVFPEGVNHTWKLAPRRATGDVALFDAIYDEVTKKYNVDLNRVYALGMSNGGYFTHLLARERSDKIAAICCHSGGLGLMTTEPKLERKFAVLIVHGSDDSIVKVEQGRQARDAYQKWGYPVEYLEIAGLNHFWARKADVNHKLWDFFMQHPLTQATE